MKHFLATFFSCLLLITTLGQGKIQLSSPDGNLAFTYNFLKSQALYNVQFKKRPIINNGLLSPTLDGLPFPKTSKQLKPRFRKGVEEYELTVGKTKKVRDEYNEVIIPFELVNIVVRVFNDGIGFRYEYVKSSSGDSLKLTDERTTFAFTGDPVVRALPLPNYTSSHEGFYLTKKLSELKEGQLLDMPALFELEGTYVAITEAALIDHAGMYLTREGSSVRSMLSPLPGQANVKVKALFPHKTPWRVLLISDRVGALIESNVITDLNEPLALNDVSWIKPGKTTFPWWNGNVTPDTLNAPGNNFVTQQYYIDFCARNNIGYHSVVEYGLHQWYVDDGIGFSPGPHSDVTRAVPGLNMKEVCDYAHSKGVGVRVWVHWAALYPKLDAAFAQFEAWGLQGMMIDFMDRDDQEMVNIQAEMLQKAAAHHLHVQFHGAYKPTGIHRTYPNEFTREGTLNYEINKWDDAGLPPDHDIMIPFTRMLAGSTDYHLGGFRAVTPEKYQQQYTRPLMLGTRGHALAMYVVLENYLGMVCDYPDAYEGQPGFDFVKSVPTNWDETRVVDAKVGEYIVIARRKGTAWFVGGLTDHNKRTVKIPLTFLHENSYTAQSYTDDPTAPNNLKIEKRAVKPADVISVDMAPGGGFVIQID